MVFYAPISMLKAVVAITLGGAGCLLLVATTACTTERPACYAGDFIACTCSNGARGYAACQPGEGLFVPCICNGMTPGAKSPADAGASDGSGGTSSKKGFLEACSTDEECTSGLCQEFPGKGAQLCSSPCKQETAATDCPPPSGGCNNQGVCKAP